MDVVRIPLRDRRGEVVAHALVDPQDAELARFKWGLGKGYVRRTGGEREWLHREIMGLTKGDGLHVDHINHDPLDCRRSNLRVVTHGQNQQNRNGAYRGSTSAFRGVSWRPDLNKWVAQAQADGRNHYLGVYVDEEKAAQVAAAFRAEHMPFSTEAIA